LEVESGSLNVVSVVCRVYHGDVEQVDERRAAGDSFEAQGQGRRSAFWILWVFVAVVAYVLSVGLVAKLDQTGVIPHGVVVLYEPLGWLSDRVRPLDRFFDWYLHVWGVK
jgi:hypothetical protein